MRNILKIIAFAAGLVTSGAASLAQEPYMPGGRPLSLVMGTGPGGSYDLYGRLIATHLARFIPGNPTIIVEHMPGAAGAIAGNYIYGPAPQDGSKILLAHPLPLIEKLQSEGVRFESRKLQWLGAYDQISQMLAIWHTSPGKSLEELKAAPIVLGSMGRTHLSFQWATLLKSAINAPFRVIPGFPTGGELNLAMERVLPLASA